MQVRSARSPRLPAKDFREKVVRVDEVGVARLAFVGLAFGCVIPVIFLARRFRARSVDFATIKSSPFLGVGQKVIGAGDLLETAFGILVAGIEIGVQLLGQAMVGLANLVLRCGARNSENFIGIFHWLPAAAGGRMGCPASSHVDARRRRKTSNG
jgi:hypothetical protein